ncbi:MAG: hypothetical protein KKA32_05615 [Actinobacteria bacterium]|nr:hypothetical protein [Actinomycetota bacterium]
MPPEDNESFFELADEERRRDTRRGSSAPFVRLMLVLAGVIVIVFVGGYLIRNWLNDRQVTTYETYLTQVAEVLKRSDTVGRDLSSLLLEPGESTRKDIQTKLDQYIATSKKLSEEATELVSPSDLKESQQWFAATMQLRSRGLENLKPALMNALEVQDVEVASDTIARAMLLLVLSDVTYEEFFVTRATQVLQDRNIEGVQVGTTDFITDSNLSSKTKIKELLATLKSTDSLQSVHGVALKLVEAFPAEKTIEVGGTYNLQATDELSFVVTVENQGNMAEKDVPVELTLSAPSSAQPQIVLIKIPELKAKEIKKITVTGVNPTDYGEKALLKVSVGPVPEEKIMENNSLEAHLIFLL